MEAFRRAKLQRLGFQMIFSVKKANDTIKNDRILSKIYDKNNKDDFF